MLSSFPCSAARPSVIAPACPTVAGTRRRRASPLDGSSCIAPSLVRAAPSGLARARVHAASTAAAVPAAPAAPAISSQQSHVRLPPAKRLRPTRPRQSYPELAQVFCELVCYDAVVMNPHAANTLPESAEPAESFHDLTPGSLPAAFAAEQALVAAATTTEHYAVSFIRRRFKPSATFVALTSDLFRSLRISTEMVYTALLLIYRFKRRQPHVLIPRVDFEYRLAVSALVLANKFLEDHTYTAKTWAGLTQLGSASAITKMELAFWRGLGYSIHVTPEQLAAFKTRTDTVRQERQRMIRQLTVQSGAQAPSATASTTSTPGALPSPRTTNPKCTTTAPSTVGVRPLGLSTPPASPYEQLALPSASTPAVVSTAATTPTQPIQPGSTTVPTAGKFSFTPPMDAPRWGDSSRSGVPSICQLTSSQVLELLRMPSSNPLSALLYLQLQAQARAQNQAQALAQAQLQAQAQLHAQLLAQAQAQAQAQARAQAQAQAEAQAQAQASNGPRLQAVYEWMVRSAQAQAQVQALNAEKLQRQAQAQLAAVQAMTQAHAQVQAQAFRQHVALGGM